MNASTAPSEAGSHAAFTTAPGEAQMARVCARQTSASDAAATTSQLASRSQRACRLDVRIERARRGFELEK